MRRLALALAVMLLSAGVAAAEDDDAIAKARKACTDMEAQTDMNICSHDLAKKVGGEMQRSQEKLLGRVDGKNKANVRDAHRAWMTYRDRHCDFEASGVEGGSAHALIYNLCVLDLNDARLKQLSYHLTCEEGDLSCPYPAAKK
jgi:uncharacterized protein YecT (DUF1311 family)